MNKRQQRAHAEDYTGWLADLYNSAFVDPTTPERKAYLQAKYNAIHAELVEQAIPIIGEIAKKKNAAWLWSLVSTERIRQGNYEGERMHANMQTAHNQLANWK